MAFYRKTTPSSYPNTPASNFTDSSKNWRKHANMYRKTSGNETASLDVPGRYTDNTRTWRRIKAMYRRTSSGTWQKIFSKFAGQPYAEVSPKIRYNSYTGTDVVDFAMMGPGANGIAQGAAGITYLWGRDGEDWQNIENLTSRSRTFVFGSRPIRENAEQVLNDEGFNEGDKLRNTEAVILQYDGKYIWYRDRISVSSTSGSSTGTSYSQTVRVIKQQPVINSIAFKTDNNVSSGEEKRVSFSIANQWYRSIDKTTSLFRWYILDSQYETPTAAKLWNSTPISIVILTEDTTVLTGEDYFTIPTTFNGVSTTGKWLHVQLVCKNTSSDNDLDYSLAPYNDVTDQVIAQIGTSLPSFTYSLTNISSVTTPSAPVQQRVSSTSNTVLVEMGSSFPSDTELYDLWSYGTGSNAGGTLANPVVQTVTTLNQYNSSGNFVITGGSFDTITSISSSASNSPISTFTQATGTSRRLQFNVSSTTGALSWRINYTISGSSSSNGTFVLNTNSMPATIQPIFGAANPTVTITGVTAYSELNQLGTTKAGTAGSTTSLSSITKPTAFSSTSTSNYTYYSNLQVTGSQRRVTLPSVFSSGTTIYVSTNGYINWGGSSLPEVERGTSISIPALDNSGITLAPLNGDLRQGSTVSSSNTSPGGLWYYADSVNFWVTWWGNYYSDATQYARYQVKFYWGSNVADVYIVNNSLTTITPSTTAVQNNLNQYQNWSATTSQISTLLSTATMNRVSTKDGFDDDRTVIVASPPVLTWTVTWDAAGGEGGTQFTTEPRGNSHTAPSPGPRNGFDFLYYRSGSGTGTDFVGSGGPYTPTGNVTFAAIWTAKTYSVTYNANSGTGAPASQTKIHGTNLTLSATVPTRATVGSSQYTFAGWNTEANGTGTSYSAGATYTLNQALSLFAQWTVTTLTWSITWGANGGTGGGTTTEPRGNSHTAPSPGTKDGFTFSSWRYFDGGTGSTYNVNSGGTFLPSSSITFTAVWNSNTVTPTITMGANSGISPTQGTINWTSTNQSTFSSTGTFSATGTTATSITKTNLTASTLYTGTVTVTSSTGNTASANYSLTTSAAPFVTPTAGPPQISNNQLGFVRSGTSITWYSDYPSVSGDVAYIIGMEWQIRTTNSTTSTPLNTGTYAGGESGVGLQGNRTSYISYPGAGTYPYAADGTIWGFRIRSTENTAATASARFARARVIMMGTNGTVYFGTWSTNI
jgi:hypothetical protein